MYEYSDELNLFETNLLMELKYDINNVYPIENQNKFVIQFRDNLNRIIINKYIDRDKWNILKYQNSIMIIKK